MFCGHDVDTGQRRHEVTFRLDCDNHCKRGSADPFGPSAWLKTLLTTKFHHCSSSDRLIAPIDMLSIYNEPAGRGGTVLASPGREDLPPRHEIK
jgi:hypothetical protein